MLGKMHIRILPYVFLSHLLDWVRYPHPGSQLEVEDVSALGEDAQDAEDEISEPEEDSLAGRMAIMRGGSVQQGQVETDDDSDSDQFPPCCAHATPCFTLVC